MAPDAADRPELYEDLSPIEVVPPRMPMAFGIAAYEPGFARVVVHWYDEPAVGAVEREVREQVSTVRF